MKGMHRVHDDRVHTTAYLHAVHRYIVAEYIVGILLHALHLLS